MGLVAWLLRTAIPARFLKLRLLLLLVAALSFFWEGGYLIKAMIDRNGDLYDFARFVLGADGLWLRVAGGAAGLALYVSTARFASRSLLQMWPANGVARDVARTAWIAATAGAAMGGALFTGHDWGNFRDAVLEIGVASLPLLFVPSGRSSGVGASPTQFIARSYPILFVALAVYAAFLASLGRGITS